MHRRVAGGVHLVGGPELSDGRDCLVYLVDAGDLVLIDCGAGEGWPRIRDNIVESGYDPGSIKTLILTHCHVDHIGAASTVRAETGCKVVAHDLDARAIETGHPALTAANWYSIRLPGAIVDHRVRGERETMVFASGTMELVHTPGHTPGSMSVLFETGGSRVLFGQDIHGPFDKSFGSDIEQWRRSMELLLALNADILCEGHYGVYSPRSAVERFIRGHVSRMAGER
jgi:glyoxylase-like metal-dependent hydrolase (beta-lactamase superfamily II)